MSASFKSAGSNGEKVNPEAFRNAIEAAPRKHVSSGLLIGDSTSAAYAGQNAIQDYILTDPNDFTGNTLNSIAVPGNTIAQQNTAWTADPNKATYDWISVMVGANDRDYSESAATALARLQALIDDINADKKPGAVILLSTIMPLRSVLLSEYGPVNGEIAYTKWQDMNAAILGGAGAITGVDYRIDSATLLSDSEGNLSFNFDTGDGIHENNVARQLYAAEIIKALHLAGFFTATPPPCLPFDDRRSALGLVTIERLASYFTDSLNSLSMAPIAISAEASGAGALSSFSYTTATSWKLDAGTTAAGYAKVAIANNWQHFNASGAGWNFARPFTVSGSFFMASSSLSAEGVHRFYLGASTANNANSNMFTDDGIGFEVATAKNGGSNTYARLTWHDGSAYQTGSWIQIAAGTISNSTPVSYKITNDGTGGVSFWIRAAIANSGPPALFGLAADYSTANGPIGATPQFTHSIYWTSENDSTAYTSSQGTIVIIDAVRFTNGMPL